MTDQPEATADLTGNPLLCAEGLPKFDQIKPEHVVPAVKNLLADAEQALSALEESIEPTWDACFAKLEEIDRPFEYAWGPVSHLFGVKNSPELREAYESVLDDVVQLGLRASQSRQIYEACVAIRNGSDWETLSPTRQRIVEKKIQSAELSGIGLEGAQQERFNEIAQELSQLSTTFSNNVLDATKLFELVLTEQTDVDGLPESALAMAAQSFNQKQSERVAEAGDDPESVDEATPESGPWRFTLDGPSFLPFMQHCRRSDLREQLYRAFLTRASEGDFNNEQNINRILALRQEKSELLGFSNFAEMSLAKKMAPSVAAVEEMFETLRSASWDAAAADIEEIRELAKSEGVTDELKHWDVAFWAERLREKKFDYTDEELRPYFPLEKALAGMIRTHGRRTNAAERGWMIASAES